MRRYVYNSVAESSLVRISGTYCQYIECGKKIFGSIVVMLINSLILAVFSCTMHDLLLSQTASRPCMCHGLTELQQVEFQLHQAVKWTLQPGRKLLASSSFPSFISLLLNACNVTETLIYNLLSHFIAQVTFPYLHSVSICMIYC